MTQEQERIGFPDGARTELERSIGELIGRAREVLATQERLRQLLRANRLVVEEIELPVVLRRIVESAVELIGARYGAIGVLAPDGTLDQFLHVGLSDEQVAEIGTLPQGRGLLGAVLSSRRPLRLDRLGDDPRSVGLPPGHPPMHGFLGVPIRVRGELFGNLYLTRDDDGRFSDEDEELVVSLAATAAAAIDHARLLDESRRRQAWAAVLADVTTALLSSDAVDGLGVIVNRVAPVIGADFGCVVVPHGQTLRVEAARGLGAPQSPAELDASSSSLVASALRAGQVVAGDLRAESPTWPEPLQWAAAVPVTAGDEPAAVLLLARRAGEERFGRADLDLAAEFAAQAGVALELARGRKDRHQLQRIEERSRIARDLHDHVIQRLFSAGLTLQGLEPVVPAAVRRSFADQVDAIDAAIAEIRTAVFALTAPPEAAPASIRHRILDVVAEVAPVLSEAPGISFAGAVDTLVPPELGDDIVAVVRESLTNVGRHARATSAHVHVAVADGALVVQVDDDGRGLGDAERSSGTANLAARAASRGGDYRLADREGGGTLMTWSVPLPEEDA